MAEQLPLIGKHIIYEYEGLGRYEAYYQSSDRIVYKIHGGPMRGRSAYQKAYYQQVAPNIYMVSWVEEIGTTVTTVINLDQKTVHGFISFSKGHWTHNVEAHGDKRNPEDLQRWRELSKIGNSTTDRVVMEDFAKIVDVSDGPGPDLEVVAEDMPIF